MLRDIDAVIVRAFLTVVETGSVTKAAMFLNLTQGAISQQIKRLEQLSGRHLFTRSGRRLVLSAEGRSLIGPAAQLISANDLLSAALRQPPFEGEVRFGAPYDIIGSYTPPILRRFSKFFPTIRVTLVCKDFGPASRRSQVRQHRSRPHHGARLRQRGGDLAQ